MSINLKYLLEDREEVEEFLPDLSSIKIVSKGCNLLGTMFTAQGKEKHPTAILLHGFPGYEENLDLAQGLRRIGLNVLTFHYRGCWSSQGNYSFTNCLEDVTSAIDFITDKKNIEQFNIDIDNLLLIGHSVGGFLALSNCMDNRIKMSVAISPFDLGLAGENIKNNNQEEVQKTIELFIGGQDPLSGTCFDRLIYEIMGNYSEWKLANKSEELANEKLLIIAAKKDTIGSYKLYHEPLIKEILKHNKNNLTEMLINTDHCYSNKRISLLKNIAYWIEKNI